MGSGIEQKNIITALFKYQYAGTILSAFVFSERISTYIIIEPVIIDLIASAAVQANTDAGIERKIIVMYFSLCAFRHHQRTLPPGNDIMDNHCFFAMLQVNTCAIP